MIEFTLIEPDRIIIFDDAQQGPGMQRWMRVYDYECQLRDFRKKSIDLGFGDPWPDQSVGKFHNRDGLL
jgi:hypothetical protein